MTFFLDVPIQNFRLFWFPSRPIWYPQSCFSQLTKFGVDWLQMDIGSSQSLINTLVLCSREQEQLPALLQHENTKNSPVTYFLTPPNTSFIRLSLLLFTMITDPLYFIIIPLSNRCISNRCLHTSISVCMFNVSFFFFIYNFVHLIHLFTKIS